MKNITILMFSLFLVNLTIAQDRAIKITNQVSKKEIIIKENKRIKIKTTDGEKISGRFSIENNAITIKNKQYAITDIEEIKRNPLLISILTGGVLIYGGAIIGGVGVLIGLLTDTTAFLLAIPAAAMIYAGTRPPNFSKKYKNDGNWTIEFVTISE